MISKTAPFGKTEGAVLFFALRKPLYYRVKVPNTLSGTEVSRDHSSEEAPVMGVERRVEALEWRSFFGKVKANENGQETNDRMDEACEQEERN